jgi:hypothetical protein
LYCDFCIVICSFVIQAMKLGAEKIGYHTSEVKNFDYQREEW